MTYRPEQGYGVDAAELLLGLEAVSDHEKRHLHHQTSSRPACPLVSRHAL